MAVTIHVNGTSNSLAHKGCMGFTKSTLPDVCKTPSPGGPVPIPYPIIVSLSNSLKKGSKTVKVDGGNPAAIKGSEYGRCNGDEPGSAGGVKSSTNMKEATWILYSFDVKIEDKNACRLSDKMMMNHGNTACLGGTIHAPVPVMDTGCDKKALKKLACECNKAINNSKADGGPCPKMPKGNAASNPGGSDCTTLGTKKHTCCELAINKHTEENSDCDFRSEVGFPEGSPDAKAQATEAYDTTKKAHMDAGMTERQAIDQCVKDEIFTTALFKASGAKCIADVVQGDPPTRAFDFKFNCADEGTISKTQIEKYKEHLKVEPEMIHSDGRQCKEDCK